MSAAWSDYEYQPSFVLGFHGCDRSIGEKILLDGGHLQPSVQDWDWLGHGIYFWEGNPSRAIQWAVQRQKAGKIETPFVLGAIIDLRHCLDLFDHDGLGEVKETHGVLMRNIGIAGTDVPRNIGNTPDKLARGLDCAVMNALHLYRKDRGESEYDSVRGPFLEGEPLYEGAGFRTENHIQLCVRNTECIKGYFRPLHRKAAP